MLWGALSTTEWVFGWLALLVCGLVMVAGLLALGVVCFWWRGARRVYSELRAKVFLAVVRSIAAAAGLFSKWELTAAPVAEQPWLWTIALAAVGFLLWEVTGVVGDRKAKQDKEQAEAASRDRVAELEAELAQARAAVDGASRLADLHVRFITGFGRLASEERERIQGVLARTTAANATIPQIQAGIAPEKEIAAILEEFTNLLVWKAASEGGPVRQNFRIGLFADTDADGALKLVAAFDLEKRRYDVFRSHVTHPECFRLTDPNDPAQPPQNPSHAVRCILERRLLIVPDCATALDFRFYNEGQRGYLRSLIAYPIENLDRCGAELIRGAIVVDTTQVGFFREEERELYETCLTTIAELIRLQYDIHRLLRREPLSEGLS